MQLIRISEPISIDVLAIVLKTNTHLLEHWNDDLFLQINKIGTNFYWLRISIDKIDFFLNNKEEIIREFAIFLVRYKNKFYFLCT
jgi:hypothetical protein